MTIFRPAQSCPLAPLSTGLPSAISNRSSARSTMVTTLNASDDAGYTALHAAAENGHIEIVKLLLYHGASKSAAVTSGQTPADLAALSGHDDMVNLLSD